MKLQKVKRQSSKIKNWSLRSIRDLQTYSALLLAYGMNLMIGLK